MVWVLAVVYAVLLGVLFRRALHADAPPVWPRKIKIEAEWEWQTAIESLAWWCEMPRADSQYREPVVDAYTLEQATASLARELSTPNRRFDAPACMSVSHALSSDIPAFPPTDFDYEFEGLAGEEAGGYEYEHARPDAETIDGLITNTEAIQQAMQL